MLQKQSLLRTEDWLAVWLGFLVIILVLVGVRPALPNFAWATDADLMGKVFSADNLTRSAIIGIAYLVLSAIGIALMGGNVVKYAMGFPIVFIIAWLSQFIAGNTTVKYWGFEYVIFALAIGLIISNLLKVPEWLREAVRTEYYIKTGLVILGAGILFYEILQAGALGII